MSYPYSYSASEFSDEETERLQAQTTHENQQNFNERYAQAKNWQERLTIIKLAYSFHTPSILAAAREGRMISPYIVDWRFTELQQYMWNEIRSIGRIPFYPQFPILNYYGDFADPGRKIVLEIASTWTVDEQKQAVRTQRITAAGWELHSLPATVVRRSLHEAYGEEYVEEIERMIAGDDMLAPEHSQQLADAKSTLDGYLLYLRRLRYGG